MLIQFSHPDERGDAHFVQAWGSADDVNLPIEDEIIEDWLLNGDAADFAPPELPLPQNVISIVAYRIRKVLEGWVN